MKKRKNQPRVIQVPLADISGSLGSYVDDYFESIAAKNYSSVTILARRYCLNHFFSWCEQHGLYYPMEITKAVMERFQRSLYIYRNPKSQAPLSFRTQQQRIVAVKQYFKWLTRSNYTLFNPASEIEMPRIEKRLPRNALTAAEADQIINLADINEPAGLRDRAIMEVLYSTGIRRMELTNLAVYDVDMARGTLFIRQGKGHKDRVVPIGDRALQWLIKYLDEVRPNLAYGRETQALFMTLTGEPMYPKEVSGRLQRYVRKANIGKAGSCHIFRHTCATLMLDNGADIRYIQEMLGHAELSTTQIYTHVSIQKLKEIHTATHPAKLGKVGGCQLPVGSEEKDERQEEPEAKTPGPPEETSSL